ncbi:hypothetical protein [Nodularia sphaerocarpa]|uniref:hypothetical protein n=1 Tax=Nodularia sphaerocarpa TaxID=137816 RepID=UPI001EFA90F1|nr:hypothetical protein [Nodularia sphaerocarpa]
MTSSHTWHIQALSANSYVRKIENNIKLIEVGYWYFGFIPGDLIAVFCLNVWKMYLDHIGFFEEYISHKSDAWTSGAKRFGELHFQVKVI